MDKGADQAVGLVAFGRLIGPNKGTEAFDTLGRRALDKTAKRWNLADRLPDPAEKRVVDFGQMTVLAGDKRRLKCTSPVG